MHARYALAALLMMAHAAHADDDVVKELSKLAGKHELISLHSADAIGTLDSGHGKTVVAYASGDAKAPFCVQTVGGEGSCMPRPGTRADVPFAIAMTNTPTGFTVFFQDVEAANANEAHTYLVELDKDGTPSTKPREVAIPWALADAAWNGKGYHLALSYTGDARGSRLSMVSTTKDGVPEQHPDWASAAGLVADVHLVASGGSVRAYYRGGMGERLLESNVTKIRGWGSEPPKAKDHGALASTHAIAITAKGVPAKLKR